jgi:PmbA protein
VKKAQESLDAVARAADAALKHGRWIANLWSEEGTRVETARGALSESERWRTASVSVEVEDAAGRVGFAQAPLGEAGFDAEAMIGRALASARALPPDSARSVPTEIAQSPAGDLGIDDAAWEGVDESRALRLAAEMEEAAWGGDARVVSVRKPSFEAVRERRVIRLGGGAETSWSATSFSLQTEVAARADGGGESAWASREACRLAGLDPRAVGEEARRRAVELLGARPAPTGVFPVVLDPRIAAEILELLAPSLLGDSEQKQTSLFQGKLGKRVLSKRLTIVDDGLLPSGADTQPVDDEGSARRKNVCVKAGVLERLLYDRTTARRCGAESTGNGAAGPSSPTGPDVTNLYILPGAASPEALLAQLAPGLWVREVMGLHTADTISGDFSVGCSGLWVEKGEIVYPVAGATLSGNLLDFLAGIVEVGSDLRFQGSLGAPSLLAEAADIAGG